MTQEHRARARSAATLIPEAMVQNFEAARLFIGSHIRSAGDGRKCVDGRYQSEENGIATPGGDFGYVLALMAVKPELTGIQAFDLVYNAVVGSDGKGTFYMHTDTHGGIIGCGHVGKALVPENADAYGVDAAKVEEAVVYAKQRIADGDSHIIMVPLKGTHKEKGVFRVHGSNYTIASSDAADDEKMYFIYDVDRDKDYIRGLARKLGVSFKEFYDKHNKQLEVILRLLASGKPVYDVDIHEANGQKSATLTYAGQVA